ncbi:DUF1501 domain-containing protein, partial [Acidobacteria bacterium AH-259-L09]|nr:DUF1501 domain-containing protein [Acidobacteria bacterium AH-259-L09]
MASKDRFGCCNLPHLNNPLWSAPNFSRRQFFQLAGPGVVGYYFSKVAHPLEVMAAAKVETQNTARSCIFILLAGAPSHVDTFDLKEGLWVPSDFAPTSYGEIRFPQGLMPNLAEELGKLAIVRSVRAWGLVHRLLRVWTQIARNPAAALGSIAPHVGAVVALEKEQPGVKLPGFIALNAGNVVGPGYFASQYAPFKLRTNRAGLPGSTHPDGQARFESRLQLLDVMDSRLRVNSPLGREAENMGVFYQQARQLMYDPEVDAVFKFTAEERTRYGENRFGDACIVARNIVKANLGTRFVQIQHGGWDNHANIYNPNGGIYIRTRALDVGLATLLQDLAAAPGLAPGKSLLDETLIVIMGEFGRTVQSLNVRQGRDHHLQQFALFAGGGVQGGRVIGATDRTGAYTEEPGWERN